MRGKIFFIVLILCSIDVFGDDWNAPTTPISQLYVYPNYVVVVQEGNYTAPMCTPGFAWSFLWADFDAATQQRIYSALLAAKLARTPIKPIFSSSSCGPEGKPKFNGQFVL
ncbi:MAG TPA: hypothetical protein PKE57_12125 [Cellvibrionaceae bacterium]|nr:hypothetical protein [Cellvibrionaceae bacterium]HMW48999.1 hypothetical protein [Cellvibrionaceae bacterium]HMW70270.1 hypothetical protein [Cellvibrionaceae bacterium]HMY39401.1 hypothetical protein [Marinagarivorans sp.]HNG59627.1 hypothetical protein [Cellvibrionaceae bacterium]